MRYKISVRPLSNDDASKDCIFPDIDNDIYDMHLNALVEDIGNLPKITCAFILNGEITIESSLDKKSLEDSMKQIFIREFCYIRFVNIIAA